MADRSEMARNAINPYPAGDGIFCCVHPVPRMLVTEYSVSLNRQCVFTNNTPARVPMFTEVGYDVTRDQSYCRTKFLRIIDN